MLSSTLYRFLSSVALAKAATQASSSSSSNAKDSAALSTVSAHITAVDFDASNVCLRALHCGVDADVPTASSAELLDDTSLPSFAFLDDSSATSTACYHDDTVSRIDWTKLVASSSSPQSHHHIIIIATYDQHRIVTDGMSNGYYPTHAYSGLALDPIPILPCTEAISPSNPTTGGCTLPIIMVMKGTANSEDDSSPSKTFDAIYALFLGAAHRQSLASMNVYYAAILTAQVGFRSSSSSLSSGPCCWLPGDRFTGEGPELFLALVYRLMELAEEEGEGASSSSWDPAQLFRPNGLLKDDPTLASKVDGRILAEVIPKMRELVKSVMHKATSGFSSRSMANLLSRPECDAMVMSIFESLQPIGCSRILGGRVTAGSSEAVARGVVPLTTPLLEAAFRRPHCVGQEMTVGHRAMAKHHHRDETDSFWGAGTLKGSPAEKNESALKCLRKVLSDVQWMNTHMLPHDVVTFELRCSSGNGARWAAKLAPAAAAAVTESGEGVSESIAFAVDRCVGQSLVVRSTEDRGSISATAWLAELEFRGFLEPADPDGHEKGWHH